MPGSEINSRAYTAIAAQWDRARHTLPDRERAYIDLCLEPLPENGVVLDLGCGTGRPIAEYCLTRGLRVVGVDQSPGMLELARARFPTGTWIDSPLEALRTETRFTAVFCWDVLFHIERDRHAAILTQIASVMLPGARLALTAGGSAHPAFTDTMFDQTFFYDSHPPERLLQILGASGFEPLHSDLIDPPTDGRDKGRLAVVARRL